MANKKNRGVGYREPPKAAQFAKGQSGNPKGRPKGSKNIATRYIAELNRKVPLTENGKKKRITKLDAIIKQQVTRGAAGDPKVGQQVLDRAVELEERQRGAPSVSPFTDADREVIHAVYQRLIDAKESNDDH